MFHFARGFALGLITGVGLGFLAFFLQKQLGLPTHFLAFDLWVGVFFGLMAGWCFSLQRILEKTFRDLFRFLADRLPWLTDALASQWLSHLREAFMVFSSKMEGVPRWFLGKWILSKLNRLGPFHAAVDRARRTWKKPTPPTPQDLAYEALGILLQPVDAVFMAAYLFLLLGACLFWSIPFLIASWS
jgi:hypothetical protein